MQSLSKIHKLPFYLLVLLLPTQLTKHFWPDFAFISGLRVDYLAPTIYFTDILIVSILALWTLEVVVMPLKIRPITRKQLIYLIRYSVSIILIPLLFVLTYALFNILFAANLWVALIKWVKIGEMGLLALYIIKTKPALKTTSAMLIIGSFYSIILAWAQFAAGGSIGGLLYFLGERSFTLSTPGIAKQTLPSTFLLNKKVLWLRPYATLPHPNVLAGLLTATLPILILYNSHARAWKIYKIPLVLLWLTTIFITGSQAALVVSLGMLFLLLKRKQKLILAVVLVVVFSIFNFQFSIFNFQFSMPQFSNPSIIRRFELSKAAWGMFKTSPIIGIGLNNFIIRLPEFYKSTEPTFFLQPVHNIYLLTTVEGGLVGLILLLLLLVKVYGVSISNSKFLISKQTPNTKHQKIWDLGIGNYLGQLEIRSIRNSWMLSLASMLFLGLLDHYPITLHQSLLLLTIILAFTYLRKSA